MKPKRQKRAAKKIDAIEFMAGQCGISDPDILLEFLGQILFGMIKKNLLFVFHDDTGLLWEKQERNLELSMNGTSVQLTLEGAGSRMMLGKQIAKIVYSKHA